MSDPETSTLNLNVFAIGASRRIGYFASLRLLRKGATVTFLLRTPGVFDDDVEMQGYVRSNKALLVRGDALKREDFVRGWAAARGASPTEHVDLVVSTVGGEPTYTWPKGFTITPPNLCTQTFHNLLTTTPPSLRPTVKILAISAAGCTRSSFSKLPLAWKPDKQGMERIVSFCMGESWDAREPGEGILGRGWEGVEGMPERGGMRRFVLVRPAALTDGECRAEMPVDGKKRKGKKGKKGKDGEGYRYGTDSEMKSNGYSVSRADVAHFMVERVVEEWERFEGKRVNVCY
ncbi:hypothetical protein BC629DRAFT_1600152 [Irpex lacteus]|nr:hypothetical protein BC629DRAFT_1600152 [Irpex lacteus]